MRRRWAAASLLLLRPRRTFDHRRCMESDSVVVIVVVLLVAAVVIAGLLLWKRKRKSEELRTRFGPEYDRTVDERGGRREAERDLTARQQRRESLEVRDLDPGQRESYSSSWRQVQTQFVDEPAAAVAQAHTLVREVMAARGYPTDDFEQQAEVVSVDHPEVVENYRVADRITRDSQEGGADTEQLREAMVRYRSLFTRLLDTDGTHETEGR